MRPQKPFSVGTTERLEKLLALTSSLDEYRRIQSIYFRSRYGFSASEIAKMVGLRLQTVRNIHSAYLKNGEEVLHLKGKGGRYHFNLTRRKKIDFYQRSRSTVNSVISWKWDDFIAPMK